MKRKNLLTTLILLLFTSFAGYGQGANCASAQGFCSDNGTQFPASTNTTAQNGPNYGCLLEQPNPAWYYLQISNPGDIEIQLSNTADEDIDFICWGPFTNLATACNNLTGGGAFSFCTLFGTYPCGNIIDCSYETDATEFVEIEDAVVGEIYMLLITNYSGEETDIIAQQIGGTGATDCSIVVDPDPDCYFTTLDVNADCVDGVYDMTGTFTFEDSPSTGTINVVVDNGTDTYTQTFNPPFVDGQVYNINIPDIPGDGAASTITVSFSADPACFIDIDYDSPMCCSMNVDATISSCDEDFNYGVSGTIVYAGSPATGTLVVEIDNGTDTYTQTFNPPFVDGQTYNFDITGIPAGGEATTLSVYFTDGAAACASVQNFTSPECSCQAEIGTFTASMTGQSTTNYILCYGDAIDIVSNDDYVTPEFIDNPNDPAPPVYDPGIAFLVYSCPPTVGLTPNYTDGPENDPCLVGVIYGTTPDDLSDFNDMSFINSNPGVFTDNTVYFVPLTFYSITDGIYSYYITGTLPCYDMGDPFMVQYLPEMEWTVDNDCATGEATATITGGLPAVEGGQFTVVPGTLTPATATFVNTSCADGGTIVLSGLNSGESYVFDITDGNACTITVSGTMSGPGAVTITYPQPDYCVNEPNPIPTLSGSPGGTYSSTAGLAIDAATGEIDLAASTPGTYTVTYLSNAVQCPPSGTTTITIHALPIVVAGVDQTVCAGTMVTLSGSGAADYDWNNGITDGVAFAANTTQTYTVTGTDANGCSNTDDVLVTIEAPFVPQFSADPLTGCSPLVVTFTNLTGGGTNCTWNFGDGGTASGCATVTHTFTTEGCYDITLSALSALGCPGSTTLENMICVTPRPHASFTAVPNILTTTESTSQMVNSSTEANAYHWDFGDNQESTQTSPFHTFPFDGPGSYVVELIAFADGIGCTDTAYTTVVVNEPLLFYVPNTFTPDDDQYNQAFFPVFTAGFDPYDFTLLIFNRWGEVIFESHNDKSGWDGTYHNQLVQEGTYTWKIEFKTLPTDARKSAVGHVNVLR